MLNAPESILPAWLQRGPSLLQVQGAGLGDRKVSQQCSQALNANSSVTAVLKRGSC